MINFDVWLRWSPTTQCNLHCTYCSNAQLQHTSLHQINIPALIETLDKIGLIFRIDFLGGGEPLLVPNIVETFVELTKKHYIFFSTNLTPRKVIQEISEKVDPSRVIKVHASLHPEELRRTNLLDVFIQP